MHVDVGGATAIGRRSENQDRWAAGPDAQWALVCDGVGGAAGGATAAELASMAAAAALAGGRPVEEVFARAHETVVAAQHADPSLGQMATTLTIARQLTGVRWRVASAGDSLAFLVGASARRLLSPHTVADELVTAGVISESDAKAHPGRNSITRGIGHSTSARPDCVDVDVVEGESIVLASDGIDVLDTGSMKRIVVEAHSAAGAAAALVEASLDEGATDNVTAVVLRLVGESVV